MPVCQYVYVNLNSSQHLEESNEAKGYHSEGCEPVHKEAWEVSSKADRGVSHLINDSAESIDHEAYGGWEWEVWESDREGDDNGKAILKEMTNASVSTVVFADDVSIV